MTANRVPRNMSSRRKHLAGSPLLLLPWIFVVIVGVLAYFALKRIDGMTYKGSGTPSQEYVSSAAVKRCIDAVPTGTLLTADAVKACLQSGTASTQTDEVVKTRIDELKWLLTLITYFGAFFAIAQGAAAWFSAEVYTKKAEDGLQSIADAVDAIKAKYPLFESIEAKRMEALAGLNSVFAAVSKAPDAWVGSAEALDWKDNLFRKLGVEARQNLLSVESFASVDLEPSLTPDEHAELLRKLALFYRSKFEYEDGVGRGAFGDLERAEAYLILANTKKQDFTIKNDLGSVYGTIYRVTNAHPDKQDDARYYLDQSENAYRKSLAIERNQQRAHYSLAVIAGRHRGNFVEALREQELALRHKVWQREPSDYMQSIIFYNTACYESQLLQKTIPAPAPISSSQAQRVVEALRQAAGLSSVRKKLIEEDFASPRGDLSGLLARADNKLRAELLKIKADLETRADQVEAAAAQKATAPDGPPKLTKAIADAVQLVWSAITGKR
jgi:hypothetical protein